MDNLGSIPPSMTDDTDLPPLNAIPPGLYRHYKGGWYEVESTARCSETLQPMVVYRALYGEAGKWVRPGWMFCGTVDLGGQQAQRFTPHDAFALVPADQATAQALVLYFSAKLGAQGATLWPAPNPPTTCCGKGCNGCVWEGYYAALEHWLAEAKRLASLSKPL